MKKYLSLFILVSSSLLLMQCQNSKSKQLVGVWKLYEMNVNGTKMPGASLGSWLWEFNREGGYMVDIASVKAKGWYKLSDNKLTVQITTAANRPKTTYLISGLDSAQLVLTSLADTNKSILSFIRMKNAFRVEND